MLTTYDRIISNARVTRTGSVTYDNRSEHELVKQLQAEVEALRQRVKELMAGAGKVAIIALFSLAFIAGCTSVDVRPAPVGMSLPVPTWEQIVKESK